LSRAGRHKSKDRVPRFGIGALYKFANAGLKLWSEVPERILGFFKGGSVSAEVTPELLGVGYIIGPQVSANMMAAACSPI